VVVSGLPESANQEAEDAQTEVQDLDRKIEQFQVDHHELKEPWANRKAAEAKR